MTKGMHKPGADVLKRVEELLREELAERGIAVDRLPPHVISGTMRCGVHPDGALSYVWDNEPILDAVPEVAEDGAVTWRLLARQRRTMQ